MSDHWTKIRDTLTENFKSDLLWLITLRGVQVRDSLQNWGYIASDRSAFSNRKETMTTPFSTASGCGHILCRAILL